MLGYRRGVFLGERGTRGVALAALSCALLFAAPAAATASSSHASVTPADGRLNLPDYSATVTAVAWPATNDGAEPTPGRRFVSFSLEVSAPGQSVSPTSPTPTLAAALRWDATSHPLSLSSIDDELGGGTGSNASASYMATVPNDTHDVDLMLSEGTFSQSFDLWSLRRVPPSPAVLYRDPNATNITGTAPGPTSLSLSNPADGFTSTASVTLQSARLGFFAPSGTTLSPGPDQAVLSVVLDAEFPNDPNDPTGSGHYLGVTTPVPASLLSFTPSGGTALPATLSDSGDTAGKGSSDDGLFDATYSFVVPATVSTGTLEVAAGSFPGAEFTLYTAESGTTTLDVAAPATLALSFPAPVAQATQTTPPWVGRPDPPTAAASSALGSHTSGGSSGLPALPISVAVVLLLVIAAAVVLVQRRRRSDRLAAAAVSTDAASWSPDPAPSPAAPLARDEEVVSPDATSGADATVETIVATPSAVAAEETPEPAPLTKAVNFVGTRDSVGLSENSSRILEAILLYLLCHDTHHLSADQVALGMWPYGRSRGEGARDTARKTIQNNASALRNWIGAEHLPDAAVAGGYLVEGIATDRGQILRLIAEADTLGGDAARALRAESLSLVRGVPFEGLSGDGYDWIEYEDLANTLTGTIVRCAQAQGSDLLGAGDFSGAETAARAGLRAARSEYALWELGARAIWAQGDRPALEAWLRKAGRELEPDDTERIRRSLGHDGSPES